MSRTSDRSLAEAIKKQFAEVKSWLNPNPKEEDWLFSDLQYNIIQPKNIQVLHDFLEQCQPHIAEANLRSAIDNLLSLLEQPPITFTKLAYLFSSQNYYEANRGFNIGKARAHLHQALENLLEKFNLDDQVFLYSNIEVFKQFKAAIEKIKASLPEGNHSSWRIAGFHLIDVQNCVAHNIDPLPAPTCQEYLKALRANNFVATAIGKNRIRVQNLLPKDFKELNTVGVKESKDVKDVKEIKEQKETWEVAIKMPTPKHIYYSATLEQEGKLIPLKKAAEILKINWITDILVDTKAPKIDEKMARQLGVQVITVYELEQIAKDCINIIDYIEIVNLGPGLGHGLRARKRTGGLVAETFIGICGGKIALSKALPTPPLNDDSKFELQSLKPEERWEANFQGNSNQCLFLQNALSEQRNRGDELLISDIKFDSSVNLSNLATANSGGTWLFCEGILFCICLTTQPIAEGEILANTSSIDWLTLRERPYQCFYKQGQSLNEQLYSFDQVTLEMEAPNEEVFVFSYPRDYFFSTMKVEGEIYLGEQRKEIIKGEESKEIKRTEFILRPSLTARQRILNNPRAMGFFLRYNEYRLISHNAYLKNLIPKRSDLKITVDDKRTQFEFSILCGFLQLSNLGLRPVTVECFLLRLQILEYFNTIDEPKPALNASKDTKETKDAPKGEIKDEKKPFFLLEDSEPDKLIVSFPSVWIQQLTEYRKQTFGLTATVSADSLVKELLDPATIPKATENKM